MKLVRYTSRTGTRVVVLLETGRKYSKLITMDMPPRITKVPKEEERNMRYISLEGNNSPENFLDTIALKYHLLDKKPLISDTVINLLGLQDVAPRKDKEDEKI